MAVFVSYDPVTDFLGLLRQAGSTAELARMPGLDYVAAAMARMGLFTTYTGQSEPTVNQVTTVWIKPALPSWTAESMVFLWNTRTNRYEIATAALWAFYLAGTVPYGYDFQSVTLAADTVAGTKSMVAVRRSAPVATALLLPPVANRAGKPLQIVDWSSSVVAHDITLSPFGSETIMRQAQWVLRSTADQLTGGTLYPSTDLNGWVIAP